MTSIKPAVRKTDFKAIEKMAHEIWSEHYTPIIGSAQVVYMLQKFQSEAAIVQQVKEGTLYFLVTYGEQPAGYISVYKKNDSLFLSKFYVLKSHRGKGIGKKAMEFIESKALQLACSSISLTVNKNNTNSIQAYKKMGFKNLDAIVIDIGNGFIMDDYLMKKMITNG